jgi:hypothetical protein
MDMAADMEGEARVGGRNRWDIPQERRVGYPAQELREAPCPIHGGARRRVSDGEEGVGCGGRNRRASISTAWNLGPPT